MIITASVVMFMLMYLNSFAFAHVFFSETRFFMTLVMAAAMAIVMLTFMLGMYRNRAVNIAIYAGAIVVFAGSLWLVRSQATVQDLSWMRAMIPHHSIAIMTSERAALSDPRVRHLADAIIDAQNREISEMRYLIRDIETNGEATSPMALGEPDGPAPIEPLMTAIATPVIASIRPAPLDDQAIRRGLGGDAACRFARAVTAQPILATNADGDAIARISGALVAFTGASDVPDAGGRFTADGAVMEVSPSNESDDGAQLIFSLGTDPALSVGFDGYWTCTR